MPGGACPAPSTWIPRDLSPPAMGSVPDERQLGGVISAIGLTPKTHVVAYDDAANANACRFLWTLDLVGHRRFSLVNGGLGA